MRWLSRNLICYCHACIMASLVWRNSRKVAGDQGCWAGRVGCKRTGPAGATVPHHTSSALLIVAKRGIFYASIISRLSAGITCFVLHLRLVTIVMEAGSCARPRRWASAHVLRPALRQAAALLVALAHMMTHPPSAGACPLPLPAPAPCSAPSHAPLPQASSLPALAPAAGALRAAQQLEVGEALHPHCWWLCLQRWRCRGAQKLAVRPLCSVPLAHTMPCPPPHLPAAPGAGGSKAARASASSHGAGSGSGAGGAGGGASIQLSAAQLAFQNATFTAASSVLSPLSITCADFRILQWGNSTDDDLGDGFSRLTGGLNGSAALTYAPKYALAQEGDRIPITSADLDTSASNVWLMEYLGTNVRAPERARPQPRLCAADACTQPAFGVHGLRATHLSSPVQTGLGVSYELYKLPKSVLAQARRAPLSTKAPPAAVQAAKYPDARPESELAELHFAGGGESQRHEHYHQLPVQQRDAAL